MNHYRQTQDSLGIVGAMAGGIFLTGFVALMVIGGYAFSPALFLAAAVAAVAGIWLLVGFHQKPQPPEGAQRTVTTAEPAQAPAASSAPAASAAPAAASAPAASDGDSAGSEPTRLEAPREGGADDLKKIKGVGPKLEDMLHSMGFYHYDQIANWTAAEVAWVDENLEGFKGRVSRDDWVAQAKTLASGEETEFSKRVDDGDVY